MSKILAYLALFTISNLTNANQLKVEVDDCGPLARGELGVVFSANPHGIGESYFTKGTAKDVCPKLTSAKYIVGFLEDICKNHKPRNKQECGALKVFVVQKYVYK